MVITNKAVLNWPKFLGEDLLGLLALAPLEFFFHQQHIITVKKIKIALT